MFQKSPTNAPKTTRMKTSKVNIPMFDPLVNGELGSPKQTEQKFIIDPSSLHSSGWVEKIDPS